MRYNSSHYLFIVAISSFLTLFMSLLIASDATAKASKKTNKKNVIITINITKQQMKVWVDNRAKYIWTISSGRKKYETPNGSYGLVRMHKKWFSRQYKASMPYSIFFYRGYAIHATNKLSKLGRPASHGCIRLHPKSAAQLFTLVKKVGMKNVKVIVADHIYEAQYRKKPKNYRRLIASNDGINADGSETKKIKSHVVVKFGRTNYLKAYPYLNDRDSGQVDRSKQEVTSKVYLSTGMSNEIY